MLKKSILGVLSVFLLIQLTSCSKTIKVVEETYPDGSPKLEKFYIEKSETEKILQKEITYYSNKQKQSEGEFKDDKRHGKWTFWYSNGNKWSEGYFDNGLDDGERNMWYENGQIRIEGKYDKGKQVGIWKFWDEKGNLVKEVDMVKFNETGKEN